MGLDKSSVIKPRRSKPAPIHTSPHTRAMALARAMARMGSPPDKGSTTARMIAASAESGPSTRMRLGPNKA
ncbi:hypothetical protein D3C72_2295900 [compost metagenome]